jgi:hypothetical protein
VSKSSRGFWCDLGSLCFPRAGVALPLKSSFEFDVIMTHLRAAPELNERLAFSQFHYFFLPVHKPRGADLAQKFDFSKAVLLSPCAFLHLSRLSFSRSFPRGTPRSHNSSNTFHNVDQPQIVFEASMAVTAKVARTSPMTSSEPSMMDSSFCYWSEMCFWQEDAHQQHEFLAMFGIAWSYDAVFGGSRRYSLSEPWKLTRKSDRIEAMLEVY